MPARALLALEHLFAAASFGGELEKLHRIEVREQVLPIAGDKGRPAQPLRGHLCKHRRRVSPDGTRQSRGGVGRRQLCTQLGRDFAGLMLSALCSNGVAFETPRVLRQQRPAVRIRCPRSARTDQKKKPPRFMAASFWGRPSRLRSKRRG